jgi:hypothetical protein
LAQLIGLRKLAVSERTHAVRKGHVRSASLSTAADIHTLLKVRFGPIADNEQLTDQLGHFYLGS